MNKLLFGLFYLMIVSCSFSFASMSNAKSYFVESENSSAFICKMPFGCIRFEQDKVIYQFVKVIEKMQDPLLFDQAFIPVKTEVHNVVLEFDGSTCSRIKGSHPIGSKTNYLLGNDSSHWKVDLENFQKLEFMDIYPGIDLVYYFVNGNLKYDFIVASGADPSIIKIKVLGNDNFALKNNKEVVISNKIAIIHDFIPESYQLSSNGKRLVDVDFVAQNSIISFNVKQYDHSNSLVIDPSLVFSTFLGGSADDYQYTGGLSRDNAGNIYETGRTFSMNFPSTPGVVQLLAGGNLDAVVYKFNSTGTNLLYSTYLGGNNVDAGYTTIVDKASSEVYVGGTTGSTNFPTTGGAYQTIYGGGLYDPFVVKLNSTGTGFVYSTFLGNGNQDLCASITVDAIGQVWVVGQTTGSYLTTAGAYQSLYGGGPWDVFIAKLNVTGTSLLVATLYGGMGDDHSHSIQLESTGNVAIMGFSNGALAMTPGAFDVTYNGGVYDLYVARFSPSLNVLTNASYIGGSGDDWAWNSFVLDQNDNAIVSGYTSSLNFPITVGSIQTIYGGGANDVLVFKLSANGSTLLNSTFFGSTGDDRGWGVVLNNFDEPIVVGEFANFLPYSFCTYDSIYGGSNDAFVTYFNSTLSSFYFSSYIGSINKDIAKNILLNGNNFVVGGSTLSPAFPTVAGSYDLTINGAEDFFLLEMDPSVGTNAVSSFNANDTICLGENILFVNNSSGASSYLWNFGDGITSNINSPTHLYLTAGDYTVSLIASSAACGLNDTSFFQIHVDEIPDASFTFIANCTGQVQFNSLNSSGVYNWNFGDGTGSTQLNPTHNYILTNIPYNVSLIITNAGACADTISAIVSTPLAPVSDFYIPDSICGLTLYFQNNSSNASQYFWEFGDGSNTSVLSPTYTYLSAGVYNIVLIADTGMCADTSSRTLTVIEKPIASFTFTTNCTGQVQFNSLNSSGVYFWNFGDGTGSTQTSPSHNYVLTNTPYNASLIITSAAGCADTMLASVSVPFAPISDFYIPDSICGLTLYFQNNSSNASQYLWDFGDGSNSSVLSPTYTYLAPGVYNIILIADTGICADTTRKTLTVIERPVAAFSYTMNCASGIVLQNLSLNSTSYSLSMGDGSSFSSFQTAYTYSVDSVYTIELIASNQYFCSDTIRTVVGTSSLPIVLILADSISCAKEIIFSCIGSANNYFWNFGDGSISMVNNPTHTYSSSGLYNISLVVSNSACKDTLYSNVEILELPDALFIIDENCNDTIHLLYDFNPSNIYNWSFGDGTSSMGFVSDYVYAQIGQYEIKLVVIDTNSCTDSSVVNAYSIDNMDLEIRYTLDTCSFSYEFIILNDSNIVHVNFGDGYSTYGNNFFHQFEFSGPKLVLFVKNFDTVCADTLIVELDVPFDLNQLYYIPNSFTPNGDGKNDFFEIKSVYDCIDFEISIYNKWGQEIFKAEDIDFKWDGTFKNLPAPEGLYVYKLKLKRKVNFEKVSRLLLLR